MYNGRYMYAKYSLHYFLMSIHLACMYSYLEKNTLYILFLGH